MDFELEINVDSINTISTNELINQWKKQTRSSPYTLISAA